MKIVWDIDGVLRSLEFFLCMHYGVPEITSWDWKHEGKSIYEWVKKDRYRILKDAQPTEYLAVALKFCPQPELWSNQPLDWRKPTHHWLHQHLGKAYTIHYLNADEKRMRLNREPKTLLVEDNPTLLSYDRIVLVDRLYNQHVNAPLRVRTPQQLEHLLRKSHGHCSASSH